MRNTVIECRSLSKRFRVCEETVDALRCVDLDVGTGELFMLVGPSECGKTTLLSIIAGMLDATTGTCRVFDRLWAKLSHREKTEHRKRHIGFVSQSVNLIPALTVLENVSVPLLISGISLRQAHRRAEEVLTTVGLANELAARPAELSSSQQYCVAIARALVHDPGLIVCDEPTSALDEDSERNSMTILRRLTREEDRCLLVATHDPQIACFADRVGYINGGIVTNIGECPAVENPRRPFRSRTLVQHTSGQYAEFVSRSR